MAVDVLTIAQFGDGAAIARVAYDDLLGNVLGFRAVVERGELVATLSRQNRQSRSYTLGPGTHQTVAVLTLAWSDA